MIEEEITTTILSNIASSSLYISYKKRGHIKIYTVSPRREATWLITEGTCSLSSEFTSHGLYRENVFQMTG